MTSGEPRIGAGPILVLGGPGLGHYQPVSEILREIAGERRVVVAVELPLDSPVVRRIRDDGFEPLTLTATSAPMGLDRVLLYVARRVERNAVPWLAGRADSGSDMPPLIARTVFAAAARIKPLRVYKRPYLQYVDRIVDELRPAVILSDINSGDGVGRVAQRYGIVWVEYCTGPVNPGRSLRAPVGPGLGPIPTWRDLVIRATLVGADRVRAARARAISRRAIPLPQRSPVIPARRIAFSSVALDAPDVFPAVPGWEQVGMPAFDHLEEPRDRDLEKTVFVTWGSAPVGSRGGLPAALLKALADLAGEGIKIIVQTSSPDVRSWADGHPSLPVCVVPSSDRPPHEWYRVSDVVVSHGGWGTIREGVAHGLPVLVLPSARGDRMDTSRRVLEAGVGAVQSPYTANARHLATVLRNLLFDDEIRRRTSEVSATLLSPRCAQSITSMLQSTDRAS